MLIRRALDICAARRFPLHLHVGIGVLDVDMPTCDPTVFTPFIRQAEQQDVPITLLHCDPFMRQSTRLAEVFSNVNFDVGVPLNFAGPQAKRTRSMALEIGPFFKHVYSSDAFGLAEAHHLGSGPRSAFCMSTDRSAVLRGPIARSRQMQPGASMTGKARVGMAAPPAAWPESVYVVSESLQC